MRKIKENIETWYKENKLMIAFALVIVSMILGFYSKAVIFKGIFKIYAPVYLITGLSLYAFSWLLLLLVAFIVGWRTVKAMHRKIRHNVKSAAKKTYYEAKYQAQNIPRRATNITKNIHRKTLNKVANASRNITNRIKKKK